MLNANETSLDDKKVTCEKIAYLHFFIGNYMLVIISCYFY